MKATRDFFGVHRNSLALLSIAAIAGCSPELLDDLVDEYPEDNFIEEFIENSIEYTIMNHAGELFKIKGNCESGEVEVINSDGKVVSVLPRSCGEISIDLSPSSPEGE